MKTVNIAHPITTLRHEGKTVQIDKAIAPLLRQAWKLGIRTTKSCQGELDGQVEIEFAEPRTIIRQRIETRPDIVSARPSSACWQYILRLCADDDELICWTAISLYFPRSQLDQVIKSFAKELRRQRAAVPGQYRPMAYCWPNAEWSYPGTADRHALVPAKLPRAAPIHPRSVL
jgi:hypothetical protein